MQIFQVAKKKHMKHSGPFRPGCDPLFSFKISSIAARDTLKKNLKIGVSHFFIIIHNGLE